jgi:hypothetical protein
VDEIDRIVGLISSKGAAWYGREIAPGVPLLRIAGGRWNGVAVVSKSGAFAAGEVVARLFEPSAEKRRAQA